MNQIIRLLASATAVWVGCSGLVSNLSGAGAHDPAFDSIPFNAWIAGADSATRIRWTVRVIPPQLTFHQRLMTAVVPEIDGAELSRRRGKGEFVAFTRWTDSAGGVYEGHTAVDLTKVEEGLSASNVSYPVRAFVRPGEYTIAVLLLDTTSKEHWSKVETLQVAPIRHDLLADAWSNLAPVEFAPNTNPPESWILPASFGRLKFPVEIKSPARIDVLVNLTPSEQQSGSDRFRNDALRALIPTLQVISEMRFNQSTLNVALLDLARHRVVVHENKVQDLTWDSLRGAFAEDATGTIDVKSLQERGKNAAFFVKEVSRRVSAEVPAGTRHAVVILSGPVEFDSGEDLRPIEAGRPNYCPVFYIRYRAPVVRQLSRDEGRGRRDMGMHRGLGPPGYVRGDTRPVADQLEKTLKPVSPRLFDVETPEQMRKALAEIRDSIAGL